MACRTRLHSVVEPCRLLRSRASRRPGFAVQPQFKDLCILCGGSTFLPRITQVGAPAALKLLRQDHTLRAAVQALEAAHTHARVPRPVGRRAVRHLPIGVALRPDALATYLSAQSKTVSLHAFEVVAPCHSC